MSADPSSSIHLRRTDENVADIEAAVERFGRRVGIAGVLAHLNRQASASPRARHRGRVGLPLERRGRGDRAVVAPGHHHVGRRQRHRGHRRPAAAGHQLVLQDGARHQPRQPGHRRRHRHPGVPPRPAGRPGARTGGRGRAQAACSSTPAGWCGAGPTCTSPAPGAACSAAWSTTSSGCDSTDDAFGYRFVLPVRFAYDAAATDGVEQMRYSFLSLDRGSRPPQLVAGEYGRRGDDPPAGALPARPRDPAPGRARGRHVATGLARRARARPHAGRRGGRATPTT